MDDFQNAATSEVPEEPVETTVADSEPSVELAPPETPAESPSSEQSALPADVVRLLREMREANPQNDTIARSLQDSYYQAKAYQETFGNMDDARSLKATLEAVGGLNGLADLQEQSEALANLDRMAAAGDPHFIEALASEEPEGFKKLVPAALEQLSRMDYRAFENVMRPHYISAILATGLGETAARAIDMLKGEHPDLALRELGNIMEWIQGLASEKAQPPVPVAAPTPQEPDTRYMDSLQSSVTPWLDNKIEGSLKSLTAKRNLSPDAVSDLSAGIRSYLDVQLAGDADYQRQLEILARVGDPERTSRYIQSRVAAMVQGAANKVFTRRYGALTPKAAAPSPTAPTPMAKASAAIQVPKPPSPSDIDMSRTTSILMMKNHAYLKSGRLVTWPK